MSDVKGYVVQWAVGARLCFDAFVDANRVLGEAEKAGEQVSILRVYVDGREERLPDLGEALAEIERLTDESAAGWAIAKVRLKLIEEQAAEIERLRTTERPEEKALREAVAAMRANISQDEREGIHGFADVSVALDALHRALWGPSGRLAGHAAKGGA